MSSSAPCVLLLLIPCQGGHSLRTGDSAQRTSHKLYIPTHSLLRYQRRSSVCCTYSAPATESGHLIAHHDADPVRVQRCGEAYPIYSGVSDSLGGSPGQW